MQLINIRHPAESVSFRTAVLTGLGRDQGLYFPARLEPLADVDAVLALPFLARSTRILAHLIGDEIEPGDLAQVVAAAFDFPIAVPAVDERVRALELFHGPSLAFKDFGARFMAQCLARFRTGGPMTILTATSGDTGAAVAHAYFGQDDIDVVVLYPRGRVSPLQEKLFCTLGGNIRTVAVEADFDTCQALVKQAFEDPDLRTGLGLNSANSINIARLLAQVCYYFEGAAAVDRDAAAPGAASHLVFSVPSGNFGNLTAGLLAHAIGLPCKRFIAATNANDTVPRFLASGRWEPHATVGTLTNAMDVSSPNNFSRILELERRHGLPLGRLLRAVAVDDAETRRAMSALHRKGYLADPHSALAWAALEGGLAPGETGVFLCTAHPAKFLEVIAETLGIEVPLPPALEEVRNRPVLSATIPGDYAALKALLQRRH